MSTPRPPRELRQLQCRFYRMVTDAWPPSSEPRLGKAVLNTIVGEEQRPPRERLSIYRSAYRARIIDALREDFPATIAVIGEKQSESLLATYLEKYPPRHFSILYAGRLLERFLRRSSFPAVPAYAADVAAVEWALTEVFIAPDSQVADAEALRALPPERWGGLRMKLIRALKILRLEWDVAPVLEAVDRGDSPPRPERNPTWIIVWRKNNASFFRRIEPAEQEALHRVRKGQTFASVCAALAPQIRTEAPASAIVNMLHRWLTDEIVEAFNAPAL